MQDMGWWHEGVFGVAVDRFLRSARSEYAFALDDFWWLDPVGVVGQYIVHLEQLCLRHNLVLYSWVEQHRAGYNRDGWSPVVGYGGHLEASLFEDVQFFLLHRLGALRVFVQVDYFWRFWLVRHLERGGKLLRAYARRQNRVRNTSDVVKWFQNWACTGCIQCKEDLESHYH